MSRVNTTAQREEPAPQPKRAAERWSPLRARLAAPWAPAPSAEPRPFAVLRRRLIVTNVLATTLVLLIVSVGAFVFESRVELAQIDNQLASEANNQASNAPTTPDNQSGPDEAPYDPQSANYFSIVVSSTGQIVQDEDQARRYDLPDMALAQPVLVGAQATTIATAQRAGIPFRLYTAPIYRDGRIVGAAQSGMSLDTYYQHLHDLCRALITLDLLIALVTLGSSVYLAERALKPARAAFERQRQFAAGASHELRTPLALIRSLAELVAGHRCAPTSAPAEQVVAEGQEVVADDAHEIIREVDYMTRLVTDLLLLARDERDRRALNWVTVDVRPLAQGVVEKAQALASARGVSLSGDLEGRADGQGQTLVAGDPDRLRELALILIENAVRYTPPGGAVTVAVGATRSAVIRGELRGHVTLTVRDNGIGIAPEDQPHVFEPFYRATSSTMRRTDASGDGANGLGLALAHWIVEAHGGQISLSSAPGKGTTFTVELPQIPHTARPTLLPSRAASQTPAPSDASL